MVLLLMLLLLLLHAWPWPLANLCRGTVLPCRPVRQPRLRLQRLQEAEPDRPGAVQPCHRRVPSGRRARRLRLPTGRRAGRSVPLWRVRRCVQHTRPGCSNETPACHTVLCIPCCRCSAASPTAAWLLPPTPPCRPVRTCELRAYRVRDGQRVQPADRQLQRCRLPD